MYMHFRNLCKSKTRLKEILGLILQSKEYESLDGYESWAEQQLWILVQGVSLIYSVKLKRALRALWELNHKFLTSFFTVEEPSMRAGWESWVTKVVQALS